MRGAHQFGAEASVAAGVSGVQAAIVAPGALPGPERRAWAASELFGEPG